MNCQKSNNLLMLYIYNIWIVFVDLTQCALPTHMETHKNAQNFSLPYTHMDVQIFEQYIYYHTRGVFLPQKLKSIVVVICIPIFMGQIRSIKS